MFIHLIYEVTSTNMTTHERDLIREQGESIREMTDTIKGLQGLMVAQAESMKIHNEKHEADMAELRPIMEGILGIKALGTFFKWVGGLVLLYFAVKAYLT